MTRTGSGHAARTLARAAVSLIVAIGAIGLGAGCGGGYERSATEESFAAASSCPAEKVLVKRREELGLRWAEQPPWSEPVPPPGVAADPARKSMWKVDRDRAYESWARSDRASRRVYPVFEASGCGSSVLYACIGAGRRGQPSCVPCDTAIGQGAATLVCAPGASCVLPAPPAAATPVSAPSP